MGLTYEITIIDHNGHELYEDSSWGNGSFQYYDGTIILRAEDGEYIKIEGALND